MLLSTRAVFTAIAAELRLFGNASDAGDHGYQESADEIIAQARAAIAAHLAGASRDDREILRGLFGDDIPTALHGGWSTATDFFKEVLLRDPALDPVTLSDRPARFSARIAEIVAAPVAPHALPALWPDHPANATTRLRAVLLRLRPGALFTPGIRDGSGGSCTLSLDGEGLRFVFHDGGPAGWTWRYELLVGGASVAAIFKDTSEPQPVTFTIRAVGEQERDALAAALGEELRGAAG